MITGSFVHNQRIERLWQDMHRCAIKLFYRLFYYLEEQGVLNPDNDVHIYALHYIYIPRVNDTLTAFKEGGTAMELELNMTSLQTNCW